MSKLEIRTESEIYLKIQYPKTIQNKKWVSVESCKLKCDHITKLFMKRHYEKAWDSFNEFIYELYGEEQLKEQDNGEDT